MSRRVCAAEVGGSVRERHGVPPASAEHTTVLSKPPTEREVAILLSRYAIRRRTK
jgi:hypothetical protein